MSKLTMLAAAGVGYVLGARAGHERYEQIKTTAQKVARDPRVQSAKDKAVDQATTQAEAAMDAAKEKVQSAVPSGGFTQQATP
ncbi:hypothetical protein GCM10027270_02990 [Nocardioides ginkgobilobae]